MSEETYNNNDNNEQYYRAVAKLVSSRRDDSFFGTATLSIGDNTLRIDNRSIKLNNSAEIQNGELMLPLEVIQELGVQVASNSNGLTLRMKNKSVEVIYSEKNISAEGNKKDWITIAFLKNGGPVLPAIVLTDQGLGFEVDYEKSTKTIRITNRYQTARLLVKFAPGKTAPKNIKATQIIAGPDGRYVYQFDTAEEAKAAGKLLRASPDVIYAEPDRFVTLTNESISKLESAGSFKVFGETPFSHLGWGAERIGADDYMNYLIAKGRQNVQVKVAVLDSGFDATHSFFAERHVPGYNAIDPNTLPLDDRGHGTHVAGTVVDVTIALPNVKIMPVKVGDFFGVYDSHVISGVRWATEQGARVINMSLGGEGVN
jgi:hypothetical protein